MARKRKANLSVSLLGLLTTLQADARRVACERKSFERRPRAGGYGNGRRRQPDGGISEVRLSITWEG
jgi:hypothetical protein